MNSDSIRLPDGRNLSYVTWGPKGGTPILYYHGTPSSRLEPAIVNAYHINLESLLVQHNLKLISVDRPGMGLSTFNPKGDFISFAADVHYLKQHLKISKCKIICWSGGGPFALAMAYRFPSEIESVYMIASFSRSFSEKGMFRKMHENKFYFGACRYLPQMTRQVTNFVLKREIKRTPPQILTGLPDVDYDLLADNTTFRHFVELTLKESNRQGSRGIVHEANLYFQNFGFRLIDIQQPVHFWWGFQDKAVIHEHAEAIEKEVRNGILHYKQNEGHLSIFVKYLEEVFKTIVS